MKEVSIIIPSWNAGSFLRECLNSICRPLDPAVREIVVVDNASTDGSSQMVADEFPEVTLIRLEKNLGFARANNLGLKRTSGPYIALVNSDVIVHPECLARLTEFLEQHNDVGLVGPKVFGSDGNLQRTCRKFPTVWNTLCRSLAFDTAFPRCPLFSGREMRHWKQDSLAEVDVLSGCFWLARRQAVEQVGDLDERFFFYAEDVDWCRRIRNADWKVMFLPQATATHFGGASSARAPHQFNIEIIRANLLYWKKHCGDAGQIGFYVLSVLHHAIRFVVRGIKVSVLTNSAGDTTDKFRRSLVCLRWLLTGKGV